MQHVSLSLLDSIRYTDCTRDWILIFLGFMNTKIRYNLSYSPLATFSFILPVTSIFGEKMFSSLYFGEQIELLSPISL